MKIIHLLLLGICFHGVQAQLAIELEQVASGFNRLVDIAFTDDNRIFGVEQDGSIRIAYQNGTLLPNPFLDISSLVTTSHNEQGLLGMTFHPDFKSNGYFYVNYTNTQGNSVIARYTRDPVDSNLADPNSAQVILTINQPRTNHNAGDLNFGPDGYLYFGMGDGGGGGDPGNNAQNTQTLLGKMIRIDVDGGSPYAVPPDNPFVNDTNVLDEIWAIGMRNPWRFSFDRLTGDMWIGDVGQMWWEEIDYEPAGSTGGRNYGWRCYEGKHVYDTVGCVDTSELTEPLYEYFHGNNACSINGGYRYRGGQHGRLYGLYLYSDFCNGMIWGLPLWSGSLWHIDLLDEEDYQLVTFGEDRWGELYVGKRGKGIVYRIADTLCQPTAIIRAPDTVTLCQGQELEAVHGQNLTYTWTRNGTTVQSNSASTYGPNQSGTYQVEVEKQPGCSALSNTVEVIYAPVTEPTIDPVGPNIPLSDPPITLTALPMGGTFSGPGILGSTFDPAVAGVGTHTIFYEFNSEGGCSGTDSIMITVFKDTGQTALPDNLLAFQVFPNPTQKDVQMRISLLKPSEVQLRLFDVQGKLVLEQAHDLPGGNTYLSLNRQGRQSGSYFLQLSMEGKNVQRAVVWQ